MPIETYGNTIIGRMDDRTWLDHAIAEYEARERAARESQPVTFTPSNQTPKLNQSAGTFAYAPVPLETRSALDAEKNSLIDRVMNQQLVEQGIRPNPTISPWSGPIQIPGGGILQSNKDTGALRTLKEPDTTTANKDWQIRTLPNGGVGRFNRATGESEILIEPNPAYEYKTTPRGGIVQIDKKTGKTTTLREGDPEKDKPDELDELDSVLLKDLLERRSVLEKLMMGRGNRGGLSSTNLDTEIDDFVRSLTNRSSNTRRSDPLGIR